MTLASTRRRNRTGYIAAASLVAVLLGTPSAPWAADDMEGRPSAEPASPPGLEESAEETVPAPPAPGAAVQVPAAVARALVEGARAEGSWGLVRALERVLDADPSLVATPARARAVAALAARIASGLPEFDEDHREALRVLILAYAPPSQRALVAERVEPALQPPAARAAAPGLPVGSFRLHPSLVVSEVWDDNIFATRSGEVEDFVTHVTPSFELRSDWDRHGLSLDGGADLSRYGDHDSEDTDDAWVGSEGHLDLDADTLLFGGGRFARAHEDRASPDEVNGKEPTVFHETTGFLGAERRFGRFGLRIGGTLDRLDFEDVGSLLGDINNDDRDRNMVTGGLRLGYRLIPRTEVFGQAAYDGRHYDSDRDDFGFDRDSDGVRLLAGLALAPRSDLWMALFAGYLGQSYRDASLEDVDAATFGAELEWSPLADTWLTVSVDRFLDETTLPGASADLVTRYAVTLEHDITPQVEGKLALAFLEDDYRGIPRSDDVYVASAGLRIDLGHHLFLAPEYRFVQRDSNVPSEDYTRSQVWLGLGADFPVPGRPRRRTRASGLAAAAAVAEAAPEPVPFDFGGPYAGFEAGAGSLLTDLDGPRRGGTSTLDTTFGDTGGTAGLFAGWGETWHGAYLGLEAEGELGGPKWRHGGEGRREFSLEEESTYGVALRAGVVLRGASLLYARGGPHWARFEGRYVLPPDDLEHHGTESGYRVGVGLEAPLSPSVFVRMEHVYSDYGRFDVAYTGATDRFAPRDTLTRLALGLHFRQLFGDGEEEPAPRAAPVDWSGPYVGAFVGHGTLGSGVKGPRENDGTLDADFSDHGWAGGLFTGYGRRCGDWYVGAELGGEASWTDWNHQRTFAGRNFSVEEKESVSAGLRLGRVVSEAALVYVKGGGARTLFSTSYLQGPVFVDQDDRRDGWQLGAGVEVAAGERTFVRLEYDYTDYGTYGLDYGSGADRFDPSSSRARLALGVRF